jgi:hypothetical protein
MALPEHDIGDSKRIKATFTDLDGNVGDPTTVVFIMKTPDGALTEYTYPTDPEVVREALGVFYVEWVFAAYGFHEASFQGTGVLATADKYKCFVKSAVTAYASTGEKPTATEVIQIRSDIDSKTSEKLELDQYIDRAHSQVKRDVEDKKSIPWSRVYDSDNGIYFDNPDSTGRNNDRLKHAISLLAIAYVFQDYSINATDVGRWWGLYEAYKMDYDNMIDTMVLDVDTDDSGTIEDSETSQKPQVFLQR